MGLFSLLFGKTKKIEHAFFGKMLFFGNRRPDSTDYFECRRLFNPSGDSIEIGIDGDVSGPTEKQVQFFKSIEENYSLVINAVTPLIEDELKNSHDNFKIIDFRTEFTPVYLDIPRCETAPVIWEIAFESDHDRDHTFTLTMHDFEAKEILIDG